MLSAVYLTKIEELGNNQKEIGFPTIEEIYYKSTIDWNDLYESITVISARTSNNLKSIYKLPYHNFTSLIKYLNKYIEAENKANNDGNNDENTRANDPQKAFGDIQGEAKKMLGASQNKLPKM